MTKHSPDLIVGRDRAHVRAILSQSPNKHVISASGFFDLVRIIPFLYDPKLKRDDKAPQVFALGILQNTKEYPISMAKNVAQLYSTLYQGCVTPEEALIANPD